MIDFSPEIVASLCAVETARASTRAATRPASGGRNETPLAGGMGLMCFDRRRLQGQKSGNASAVYLPYGTLRFARHGGAQHPINDTRNPHRAIVATDCQEADFWSR